MTPQLFHPAILITPKLVEHRNFFIYFVVQKNNKQS